MPMVRRFGFCSRLGTSRVASSRKVYGPGVNAFSVRYWLLSTRAYLAISDRSRQTSVKL